MTDYDAIVVGGGHNGLTAGAYLARAGLRVCVVERRDILGGACVTEEVWPGHRISRASYVVSLLQPKVVEDLRLKDFGYEVHPLDPAYAAIDGDGRVMFFHNDQQQTVDSLARFSKKDAAAYPAFEDLLERMAGFLRPLMLRPPPALGSKRPGDLLGLLREAGRAAGLSKRDVHDFYRVMTMSVGDLLDDWFENDLFKGATASTGVVGVWAGPRTPGTAYNLLHHALGEIDGVPGLWGHVKGGMGSISMSIARSAESFGAVMRTGAGVASIDVRDGRVLGVTLDSGEALTAPLVVSGAHPKTTVLDLAGAEHFPDEVVQDLQRYKTRGGSVKVNWVLSEPPRYEGVTDADAEHAAALRRRLLPLDRLPRARLAGRGARQAVGGALPRGRGADDDRQVADRRRLDRGDDVHPVRPLQRGGLARGLARALRAAVPRHAGRGRAERQGRGRAPRGARPAGPRADLRAARRQHLPGRAGARPDGVHAARRRRSRSTRRRSTASTCAAPGRTRAAA